MRSTDEVAPLFIELRMNSFRAIRGDQIEGGDLIRTAEGRLTEESRRQLVESIRRLIPSVVRGSSLQCHCAIPGTGVLLHRVRLPSASREETARLLRLRVESEFPLGPDDLAWGYASGPTASDGSREFRLAAVRKEVMTEYLQLFRTLDLSPIISVAALARMELLPDATTAGALLDVGPSEAELIVIENGQAISIRGFPSGAANGDGFDWAGALRREGLKGRLYHTGIPAQRLEGSAEAKWEALSFDSKTSPTTAIAGLRQLAVMGARNSILPLNGDQVPVPSKPMPSWPIPWLALAAVLLLCFLVAPFIEALWRGPRLAKQVATIKANTKNLTLIDREFGFLRHLEISQPPYVDALYHIANSAAPGLRIESTSMNRRGEVALRGKTQNMGQIGELRTKLIASGFFSSVVVEDQTQGQDRQVQFRLSARWKNSDERETLSQGPEVAVTNKPTAATNLPTTATTNQPATTATNQATSATNRPTTATNQPTATTNKPAGSTINPLTPPQ